MEFADTQPLSVAQAKTGTGKTIAFLLPLLQRMLSEDPSLSSRQASRTASSDDIRGIILSPTRELAEQIAVEARALTKHTGLVVQTAVGGTSKASMLRETQRRGCHLMVATPGRLNDLLSDQSSGIDAPNLAALVLDEADRMLDVGFEQELNSILDMLPYTSEKERQTMLVSATIPDNVIRLARSMVRPSNFEFVQTIPENESLTHDKVPQRVVPVSSWANMFPALFELMERESVKAAENPDSPPFKAIVYFNTTALVELAGGLSNSRKRSRQTNIYHQCIHSKLSQVQRTRAADSFRRAKSGVLFSSDVTARGMDFPNVTHVIQVDMARDRESYIHRLGRTGRQDKYGEGWLLLPPLSVQAGKRMLRGLPLKQDKSLDAAEAETDTDDLPRQHQEFQDAITMVPRNVLSSAYQSLFGQTSDADQLAEDLHHWVTRIWGWSQLPPVSQKLARNLGLSTRSPYVNVMDERTSFSRFGSDDAPASRGRHAQNDDPFSSMRRNVRSDRDRRGGGRGRGRGRDGSGGSSW